ncbi:MAG: hypothetical protein AAF485_17480 [Chloroflexota bacterium]
MIKNENLLPNLLGFAVYVPKPIANETQKLAPFTSFPWLYPTYF